jgi:ankyrin repeat protein
MEDKREELLLYMFQDCGHVVRVLLANAAELLNEALSEDGWTALHHASSGGTLESLRVLLQAGAVEVYIYIF